MTSITPPTSSGSSAEVGPPKSIICGFIARARAIVYFMDEGEFVEIGPPEQVLAEPKDERTRRFLKRFLNV